MAEPERCRQAQCLMCIVSYLRRWQGKEIPALSASALMHKTGLTHGEDSPSCCHCISQVSAKLHFSGYNSLLPNSICSVDSPSPVLSSIAKLQGQGKRSSTVQDVRGWDLLLSSSGTEAQPVRDHSQRLVPVSKGQCDLPWRQGMTVTSGICVHLQEDEFVLCWWIICEWSFCQQ